KQLGSGLSDEERAAEAKRREEGLRRRRERIEREKSEALPEGGNLKDNAKI
ncbi:hypothetical protein HDU93_009772, partial [Gonapodya sp. JEL0774]